MADQRDPKKNEQSRDERLKAALKANLARRKAQAKKRATDQVDQQDKTSG